MLTTVALVALSQGSQAAAPGELISKMLAKYHEATTITGKIVFTQSAGGKTVRGDTVLQISRPDKLYISQSLPSPQPMRSLVVSDGKRFAYDLPRQLLRKEDNERLVEPASQNGKVFDVGKVYAAASQSLLDRSTPLDVAVSRVEDLTYLRNQWATVEPQGTEQIGGKTAHLVGGEWREYGAAPASGKYQMAISADGDLLRFTKKEIVAIPELPNIPPQEITSTWGVQLQVNGKLDPALFVVK